MFNYRTNKLWIAVVMAILLPGTANFFAREGESAYRLDNGMEVILKENHASPMVAGVLFVRSGSRYESKYENGITHFLEHLLFDGTVNLTREDLDGSIRNLGGYINAFTRKDLTGYMVLVPKQYSEYGLTTQADMVFNSLIPEAELPKERQVVTEEINRSADSPGAAADAFFTEKAYAGTDYARPVLGYRSFIENIPRDAIVTYWKKYYTPDNMTLLVIGDFESEQMKKTVADIFGRFQATTEPAETTPADRHQVLAGTKAKNGELTGQSRFDTVANLNSTYINFSIAAPKITDPDYLPFDVLASWLNMSDVSPLKVALQSGAEPLAEQVSVTLSTHEEFSRLDISAITGNPDRRDLIVQTVLSELSRLGQAEIDPEIVAGIKTSVRCDAIYTAEKLHYYGFMIAPLMMSAGWDFIQAYPSLLDTVEATHILAVADRWLANPNYVVTVVRPGDTTAGSTTVLYKPTETGAEEVIAHFDTTVFEEIDVSVGTPLAYPDVDSVKFELVDRAVYHREVLDNGLTVIIKSSPDSRVFAVNILGENRTANEPEGKAGITDFVNRVMEKSTTSRDAAQLSRELNSIGAKLTMYDNPWIPYDDRYTTRSYSFIKFETIDEFATTGFDLLCDMLLNPAFDSAEVEATRQEMIGILGRSASSPTKVARQAFYETLFAGGLFARPVMGSVESLSGITLGDLKDHHRKFYSPANMIVTIATSHDPSHVMAWVKDKLGAASDVGPASAGPVLGELASSHNQVHIDLDKEQVGIYAGNRLPGANDPQAADLNIAAAVLSSRLYLNLREKQGLAYSTSAGTGFDRSFGWYYLSIGAGADKYQQALAGLNLQTEKLALDGPTAAEVNTARNRMWGRLMSAKLSRINQAFYLGINEFLGRDVDYDQQLLERLESVNVQTVRQAAARYFNPGNWITASAGRAQ